MKVFEKSGKPEYPENKKKEQKTKKKIREEQRPNKI